MNLRALIVRRMIFLLVQCILLLQFALVCLPAAVSSSADVNAYDTDGAVVAFAHDSVSGITYIGGGFSQVGAAVGSWAPFDPTSGMVDRSWPRVTGGTVTAMTSDGEGGYYIGGNFLKVGGVSRNHLAHILSNKTVDLTWNPNPDGSSISSIATSPLSVYIAGSFSHIGGSARAGLAEVNRTDGTATSWDVAPNNAVNFITVSGSTVFVSGLFTSIGGVSRNYLAAIGRGTGIIAEDWNPAPDGPAVTVAVDGGQLYLAGSFTHIGGMSRNGLAAVNLADASIPSWSPNRVGSVQAIAVSGSTVYLGGNFSVIAGASRSNLAAVNATTGVITSWVPTINGAVSQLIVSAGSIYVSGSFTSAGGQARDRLAAFDTSGSLLTWNPKADAVASSILASDGRILISGSFALVNRVDRQNVAALDATGAPTAWNPGAGGVVGALEIIGTTVYMGGEFVTIAGQNRNYLAAVDTGGSLTSWSPNANGVVRCMSVESGVIYVGGDFTSVGGQSRIQVAALDTTGAATSWAPNCTGGEVNVITATSSYVYVGGNFQNIGGQSRSCLAQVDMSGVVTAWNPSPANPGDGYHRGRVRGIVPIGALVYIGGYFTEVSGQSRAHLACIDSSGSPTAWDPSSSGGDAILRMTQLSGIIYITGNFTVVGGQSRQGSANIDASGTVLDWSPGTTGYGLYAAVDKVYLGGLLTVTNNVPRNYLAIFGTDTVAPTVTVSADPVISNAPLTFTLAFSESVTGLTSAGITVTNGTKGAVVGSGSLWTISVTPTSYGPVTCQVQAGAALSGASTANSASNISSVNYRVSPTISVRYPALSGGTYIANQSSLLFQLDLTDSYIGSYDPFLCVTYQMSGATTGSGSADTSSYWPNRDIFFSVNPGITTMTIFALDSIGLSATLTLTIIDASPYIGAISPTSGLVGASVTLTGVNFTGATSVQFNGAAALFTVNSDTSITATVPTGAATGVIAVTTPNGTATSAMNFTVLLPQTISFTVIGNQTIGVAPLTLNATATSGLAPTFSVLSGPATLSGAILTITGRGTITVAADQSGNSIFAAAPRVTQSFAVTYVGETILPAGYIRNLLHLGSLQSDRITGTQPGGPNIALDDFLYAGYGPEYKQQPAQGQTVNLGVSTTQTPMVWTDTTATRGDGVWDDGYGGDHYRQYYAMTLIVPSTRSAQIAYWIDDRVRVWMDGNATLVLAVDANGSGSSNTFTLTAGIHRFIFKYEQITSSSVFALKFTDTAGVDMADLSYTLSDVIPPTVASVVPTDGSGAVSPTSSIQVTFSEPMDTSVAPSSIASILGGVATGTWTWTDRFHLTWTPSGPLVDGTTYTVTLSTAAVDRNGNALASMYSTSFTTLTHGAWNTVGNGFDATVWHLGTYSGDVVAGGDFAFSGVTGIVGLAHWNGAAWRSFGSGLSAGNAGPMVEYNSKLYMGGTFSQIGGVTSANFASWDGSAWHDESGGTFTGPTDGVVVHQGMLYATCGGTVYQQSGSTWIAIGTASDRTRVFSDSLGLIIAGHISSVQGVPVHGIARWDGTSWFDLGMGLQASSGWLEGQRIIRYQGMLIAVGQFDINEASVVTGSHIAWWDGSTWRALGHGVTAGQKVICAEVFNGDLVVGGSFSSVGGVPASNIAMWDGATWSPFGFGADAQVNDVLTVDRHLWFGGGFSTISGVSASMVAEWVPGSQTISFPTIGNQTFGVSPLTLNATADSGLIPTFSVLSGPATVSGTTLTITGVGTIVIAANQAGNWKCDPAPQVTQSISVAQAAQTISSFATIGNQVFGVAPLTLSATATSGLTPTFSVLSGPATVSGTTLTITGVGTVVVAADQAGDSSYLAAPQVIQTITVAVPAPVITSILTASGTVGTAFTYQITASNSPTSFNTLGLPAGLSIDTTTGIISGTPTTAGTTGVTIAAINGTGTGTAGLVLTVAAASGSASSSGGSSSGGGAPCGVGALSGLLIGCFVWLRRRRR